MLHPRRYRQRPRRVVQIAGAHKLRSDGPVDVVHARQAVLLEYHETDGLVLVPIRPPQGDEESAEHRRPCLQPLPVVIVDTRLMEEPRADGMAAPPRTLSPLDNCECPAHFRRMGTAHGRALPQPTPADDGEAPGPRVRTGRLVGLAGRPSHCQMSVVAARIRS